MLPTFDVQEAFVNPLPSPGQSVDVGIIPNVVPNVDGSRMVVISEDNDDWDLESAVVLVEVRRVVGKHRFRIIQESCRVMLRKVPSTIPDATEPANELVKQSGEYEAHVTNDDAPVTQSAVEFEVV